MRFVGALVLASLLVVSSSPALASSYVKTDLTIVDPILYTAAAGGGVHPYSGTNLAPGAFLNGADLIGSYLRGAYLPSTGEGR